MKSRISVDDVVDIGHNVFRYSGFVLRSLFRNSAEETPSCGSTYRGGNWVNAPVTLEQSRVERYLKDAPLESKSLLHVGVGSSSIAKKLHQKCKRIDGITVSEGELEYAQSLGISNYNVYLMNKYTDKITALPSGYDYIVDTNLSSFTSSRPDMDAMIKRYVALLDNGGMLLTDRLGMHFHEPYSFPIYDEDLMAFERVLPVKFEKITRAVRALSKIQA